MLEVRDLRLQYGGIQAVKGISFDVAQGELVALIGANGAGKTSTLKALARMLPQATGKVCLNPANQPAVDLMQLPAHELIAQGVALVPEGRGVFSRQTVLENLQLPAKPVWVRQSGAKPLRPLALDLLNRPLRPLKLRQRLIQCAVVKVELQAAGLLRKRVEFPASNA